MSVEVGVGRFSIYGGGFVGMYKDVEVRSKSYYHTLLRFVTLYYVVMI